MTNFLLTFMLLYFTLNHSIGTHSKPSADVSLLFSMFYRSCWVCFATDEDDRTAEWVRPCRCRGSTKWVHQSCLQRWVDEKQRGNSTARVACPQCNAEYLIVFPKLGMTALQCWSVSQLLKTDLVSVFNIQREYMFRKPVVFTITFDDVVTL